MAESNYCDKLMQNDLVNLWKLTKSLRSMLVECQKLIHAEASKIELECLDKIKDLEAERVENRSQLLQATEEIKQLKQSNEEFCKEIAFHKSQSSHQDEVCKDLAKQLMEAETKLESYQSRNLNLEEEMKSQVCDNLSLLARVGELEGHTVALSQHMEGKRDERNILEDKTSDLEVMIAENEIHLQDLQDHNNQLEEICSTLRDQRDQQSQYFIQREATLTAKHESQLEEMTQRNSFLNGELSNLNQRLGQMSDEVDLLQQTRSSSFAQISSLKTTVKDRDLKINSLEGELKVEKQTVEMLTTKNHELSMEAAQCKKEMARCANGAEFSKQALDQIEGLVDDIYERKRIMLSEMENAVEDGCLKRLADCERSLAVEKYKHANCDSRIQELQSQLEAANRTSDIMMSLSATRCSRNLNRSLNSSKSTFAVKLNALELSVFPDGNKENYAVDGKVSDVMLTLEAPPRLSEQQAGKLKLLNESALKKIKQMDSL